MPKMTPEELEEAKSNLRTEAKRRMAERGMIQVRCEPQIMHQLFDLAEQRGTNFAEMVRTWIFERLAEEQKMEQGAADISLRITMIRSELKEAVKLLDTLEAERNERRKTAG